jgi:bifunctional non-homologous end joining protein LigD
MIFTPIKPMLLHKGEEIIDDSKWIYDIKWDGWRILLHKQGDRIEAYTRHGTLVTERFPELKELAQSIKTHEAILDCEGVVLRNGVSVFDDFTYRGKLIRPEKIKESISTHPATFIAFDVLSTNKPHINEPLTERKQRLTDIIQPSNSLIATPSIKGEGNHLFQLTKEKNMEGIIGKRADSIYRINYRSYDWLKFKHFKQTPAIILGYKENPFTMIVGQFVGKGKPKPVASVEFGFKPEEKQAFRKIAKGIEWKEDRGVTWIEPVLCCTVQYLEKTENQMLRTVSFKGFNFEKKPEDCMIG